MTNDATSKMLVDNTLDRYKIGSEDAERVKRAPAPDVRKRRTRPVRE